MTFTLMIDCTGSVFGDPPEDDKESAPLVLTNARIIETARILRGCAESIEFLGVSGSASLILTDSQGNAVGRAVFAT